VSSFRLDRYAVTVGRFRQFVAAWNSGYVPPAGSGKHVHLNGGRGLSDSHGGFEPGWSPVHDAFVQPTAANLGCHSPPDAYNPGNGTWTDAPGPNDNLPINCVTWQEAFAFCIYDGGFLPSEAELAFAAAGGDQEREYPWGATDPGTDSRYAIYNCLYRDASGGCAIAPVGWAAEGAGRWGHFDLAGNVMAWSQDVSTYPKYTDPCQDCTVTAAATGAPKSRAKRGGHFGTFAPADLRSAARFEDTATGRDPMNGVRCARTPCCGP
jgi:formylglycine-generating enzyme required for sulfatase activity